MLQSYNAIIVLVSFAHCNKEESNVVGVAFCYISYSRFLAVGSFST